MSSSRAITTFFDLQGGLRSDVDSRPTRNWAAFGIQGLAPYFFDLEVTGYVSGKGHLAGKLEASYDLLLTQRLILQPQIEVNLYSKADPARLVGAAPLGGVMTTESLVHMYAQSPITLIS